MRGKTVAIDSQSPESRNIDKAARVIKAGGLVVYPTETFYALGADALNERAVRKVYEVKGRSFSKALTLIIHNRESLLPLVAAVPPGAEKLMAKFWPGPLTIVFKAAGILPSLVTAGTGSIGIRIPSSATAIALACATGRPLTATSANPSGLRGFTRAGEASASLGEEIDMILDGGRTRGGTASTIVDFTVPPPVLIRTGTISREMLEKCLNIKITVP